MHRSIAAGIAALGLLTQGSAFLETAARGATVAPPIPVRYMLTPGDYMLAIHLFAEESSRHEEEPVEVVIQNGKVVIKLNDDPSVSFTSAMPHSTMTFRFGDGTDDVVLRGRLTADDELEGMFVVESFGVGQEHGTFRLTKTK
jgi:hypothetical protein